jgi:arylformamidase
MDIFPATRTAAGALSPVHVHLHGGRWRILSKDETAIIAPTFVEAGIAFVTLNFSLIPKVRLPQMIEQLRKAIAWVYANAASFGGDANRIHLSGHSSGAHLAGVLLTTDWKARGLPENVIKSGLLLSGMYDMRPVMLSERASYVKLSEAEVLDLSAILHVERINAPLTLGYGSNETPEFQRHPQAFAETLRAAGKPVSVFKVDGANHYEMLREFTDANTPLARAALAAAGIAA